MHEGEPSRVRGIVTDRLGKDRREFIIEFAGHHPAAAGEQFLGHRSRARAYLKDHIARSDTRSIDELANQVVIDQEVLPERPLGPQPARLEQGLDVGE